MDAYYEPLIDSGYVPDYITRRGIQYLLSRRIQQLEKGGVTENNAAKVEFIKSLREVNQVAIHTKEANEQHYEVPTKFFLKSLGKRLKYSSCYFESGATNLDEAEEAMLALYAERAEIVDGQSILDLGCGWGSNCLYLCEKFPNCKITALSNSNTQREYIMGVAKSKGFKNLEVFTGDINTFQWPTPKIFDRIVTVEMFEHMKNYEALLHKVSTWLVPETGRLFIHVFCHKSQPYSFNTDEANSWMAKYFFTGGTMPSEDFFLWFQKHVEVVDRWSVNGKNYGQTSEEWLKLMDANKKEIMPTFVECYGEKDASIWFQRWRVFYLACAELFNYADGQEWFVVHYLMKRR
ncbi:hypothetical protein HK098_001101 [Nowakowskiella sp. JEL0407]|nr:hypothetical protein HK098_001101 [Nowakowskiella sp. JEL0407]